MHTDLSDIPLNFSFTILAVNFYRMFTFFKMFTLEEKRNFLNNNFSEKNFYYNVYLFVYKEVLFFDYRSIK